MLWRHERAAVIEYLNSDVVNHKPSFIYTQLTRRQLMRPVPKRETLVISYGAVRPREQKKADI